MQQMLKKADSDTDTTLWYHSHTLKNSIPYQILHLRYDAITGATAPEGFEIPKTTGFRIIVG